MLCKTCDHWTITDFSRQMLAQDACGICNKLPGDKVEISLITGWDGGVVDDIETEWDFFCAYHQNNIT